jgi:membrane protein
MGTRGRKAYPGIGIQLNTQDHQGFMSKYWDILKKAYADIVNNHTMAMAAGLSYYFVMSLFPLLILAATILGLFPSADLFDRVVGAMARVVPPDSMGLVRAVLNDVLKANKVGVLTFGVVGTLWAAIGGFNSLIEALNVAYDIPETRPWWKTRLIAIGLMVVMGGLLLAGVILMVLGPQFGAWLATKTSIVGLGFAYMWPTLRWVLSITFVVLAVEIMFFWAPNVKQRFWASLPGAVIGTATWIGSSHLLGLYFRTYANYNRTYGTLAGAIALMAWLYYSWFMILIGAEINSELLKLNDEGRLPLKAPPPEAVRVRPAWEEDTRLDSDKVKDRAA